MSHAAPAGSRRGTRAGRAIALAVPGALVPFLMFLSVFAPGANAGTILADSGFRVTPNGFSFDNYGNDEGYAGLNPTEVRRIFGDQVCVAGRGAGCVLTPGARYWMKDVNQAMGGGHCYGMAMLASITHRGQLPRFGIDSIGALGGGPDAYDLQIENNRPLQRAIARAFAMQAASAVRENTVDGTPSQILDKLRQQLKPGNPETWQLTIFRWGMKNGHAVTPYAVEDMGDGIFHVHVYDNNWPGDDARRLEIDTNKNMWKYFAATNPSQTGAWYIGDASSGTLRLMPNEPAFGAQDCPVCAGRKGARSRYNQISLTGKAPQTAHVVITDRRGRKLGVIGGKLVNQIPGAKVQARTSGPIATPSGELENLDDTTDPIYFVPKRLKLKIKVNGRRLTRPVTQTLTVVGPTFDSKVEQIRLRPRQVAHATLNPARRTLSFTSVRKAAFPTVSFGAESKFAGYDIKVFTPDLRNGGSVFFAKKPRFNMLRMAPRRKGKQEMGVMIERQTKNGDTKFIAQWTLRGRQQAYLYYGPLGRKNGIAKVVIAVPGKEHRARVIRLRELD